MKTLYFSALFLYNRDVEKTNGKVTSNTEMITISRAEYEAMQKELHQLEETCTEKAQALTAALLQNDWLLEQLKLSRKKLFGKSTEQADEAVMDQLSFVFNEAEAMDAKSVEEAPSESKVKSYIRKRRSAALRM